MVPDRWSTTAAVHPWSACVTTTTCSIGSAWWDGDDEPSGEFKAPLAIHVHFSEDHLRPLRPLHLLNNVGNPLSLRYPAGATLCLSSVIDLTGSWRRRGGVCCDMKALGKYFDCTANHKLGCNFRKLHKRRKDLLPGSQMTVWKANLRKFCPSKYCNHLREFRIQGSNQSFLLFLQPVWRPLLVKR